MAGPKIDQDSLRKTLYEVIRKRLAIQRVSGDILPMEQCYINLAVVEHQRREAEQSTVFQRSPSFESVHTTNLQRPSALESLFQPRKLKQGATGVPQRILIYGRAGIDKTTLSKKSVYDYVENQRWQAT